MTSRGWVRALRAWNGGIVVPILAYHDVGIDRGRHSIAPARLLGHLEWFAANAQVLDAQELPTLLRGRSGISRGVVITFDDGYRSVFQDAFPILHRLQLPFTVFATTGSVGLRHRLDGVERPMMSWAEMDEMSRSGLASVGSHTRSHVVLVGQSVETVAAELDDSVRDIERAIGVAPRLFAAPKGKLDEASRRVALDRFDLVMASEGLARPNKTGRIVPRVAVADRMAIGSLLATFAPAYWPLKSAAGRIRARVLSA